MKAEDIKQALIKYGYERNISYDPAYFKHNMPEFLRVAEISFKAGQEEGRRETWDTAIEAAIRETRREVVEWLQNHLEANIVYDGMLTISEDVLQAKLKEWGLK